MQGLPREPRIGIIVVAYNAETTLRRVLDRIPDDIWERIAAVWVSDDESADATYARALDWRADHPGRPVEVVRQLRNLGYGGNQKTGYRWAIESDLDIVVLLHGDGQYAPELIGELVAPIVAGDADAVLGSRMSVPGDARRGGMPRYKYLGNRVLTRLQNAIAGTSLTEWHSGYRAYAVPALRAVAFERNSDGFDFDTEILLQLLSAGRRIEEVPIPTYYGGEISYVNGMRYAADVMLDMAAWRLGRVGFGSGSLGPVGDDYAAHSAEGTSHQSIVARMGTEAPAKVLDLGCSSGAVGALLRQQGHHVVGVDRLALPGVEDRVDRFVRADLEAGVPAEVGNGYDVVIAADVLEHVSDPARLLGQIRTLVHDDGLVLASLPNIAHWYPRLRVALGWFDYDQRGILDSTHLRFFTRRSARNLARTSGFSVVAEHELGMPVEVVTTGGRIMTALKGIERLGLRLRPPLFAYQYLLELRPLVVTTRMAL